MYIVLNTAKYTVVDFVQYIVFVPYTEGHQLQFTVECSVQHIA